MTPTRPAATGKLANLSPSRSMMSLMDDPCLTASAIRSDNRL
jgi:hypothetical protein